MTFYLLSHNYLILFTKKQVLGPVWSMYIRRHVKEYWETDKFTSSGSPSSPPPQTLHPEARVPEAFPQVSLLPSSSARLASICPVFILSKLCSWLEVTTQTNLSPRVKNRL